MTRGKSVLGIAVLFALALSVFGASSASAKGTTAFTCVKGKGVLNGAHCLGTSGGEYGHVEIAKDTPTTITGTSENTAAETTAGSPAILQGALSGVVTELSCSKNTGEGTFENHTLGEEMYLHAEGTIHYTGCVVKAPAGKGCKVAGETVLTEPITGTSLEQGDFIKIQPKEGTTFAKIKIEGCSIESLNNTFPVTGSLKAKTNGATLLADKAEITTQNTLKFGGVKAGLEGALTIKGHKAGEEVTNPLSATTN